jgi:predicted amidophosphoribosyltransferase
VPAPGVVRLRALADDPERPRAEKGDARDCAVARYALPFDGTARALVHALKYSGRRGAAGILVSAAADEARVAARAGVDALVPVPLHPSRQRERGFNQAEVLARGLAALLDVPVAAGCLARTRATRTQTGAPPTFGERSRRTRRRGSSAPCSWTTS